MGPAGKREATHTGAARLWFVSFLVSNEVCFNMECTMSLAPLLGSDVRRDLSPTGNEVCGGTRERSTLGQPYVPTHPWHTDDMT